MEFVLDNNMFNQLSDFELSNIEGGGWATVVGAIAVGVIGIVAGPPAAVTGAIAVGAWYVGSGLIAVAGVVSACGK